MLSNVIGAWAALAITLTGATQLRILVSPPVGSGEILLVLWMLFVVLSLLWKVPFSYSDAFRPVAVYWAIAAVLLGAGSTVAVMMDQQDGPTARHDALAFAFIGPLTCLLAIRIGNVPDRRHYLNLARALLFFISAVSLVLVTASLRSGQLGPISLWYHQARFRGWSENPNQFALFMLPMPFLGWYLMKEARGFGRKFAYLAAIGTCVMAGLMTKSDSLRLAWVGGAISIAVWLWYRIIVRGRGQFVYVSHVIVPILGVTLALALGDELIAKIAQISDELYEKGQRGHIGISALMNGLAAISRSPLVGWGPGAYSGIYRPFDSFEAHNTFVDWGMSTGGLGMLLYLGLLLWCAVRAIRSGSPWLLGVLITMVVDSLFGYSLRQPMFWLMLVLVGTLSEPAPRRTPSSVVLAQRPV